MPFSKEYAGQPHMSDILASITRRKKQCEDDVHVVLT